MDGRWGEPARLEKKCQRESSHPQAVSWSRLPIKDPFVIPGGVVTRAWPQLTKAYPGTVFVRRLAGSTVWWPGTDSDLEETGRDLAPPVPGAGCPVGSDREAWPGLRGESSRAFSGKGFWAVVSSL